jgi:hypothetical protein
MRNKPLMMRWFQAPVVLAALFALAWPARSQSILWRANIESTGPSADLGGLLRSDATGRILLVGLKTVRGSSDRSGDVQYLWRNGAASVSGVYRATSGQPLDLFDAGIDRQGGAYLLYRDSGLAVYGLGLTLAKFSPSTGKPLWTVSLAEPPGGTLIGGKMAIDATGHIAFGTTDWSPDRPSRFRLARVSPDGRLLLNRLLNRSSDLYDNLKAVTVDGSGSVYLTGSAGPDPRADREAVSAAQILTYRVRATNASVFWARPYPTFGAFSDMKLALDPFGDVVVAAKRTDGITFLNAFATLKLAGSGGATLWFRTYSAPQGGDMTLTDLAVRGDGSVVLAGDCSHPDTYDQGGLVVAWDRSGNPLWARHLVGSELWGPAPVAETWFNDRLAVDPAGNVYFGSTEVGFEVYGRLTSGFVLTKLEGVSGGTLWRRAYRPASTGSHSTSAVALANGAPVIAGTVESGPLATPAVQSFLQAVDPATGSAAWSTRSSVGNGPQADRIEWIEVATNGDTVWAGSQGGSFAVGLVASNGARLWTWVFDDQTSFEPKSVAEGAYQVRFDPEGHVVAFGQNRGVAVVARLGRATGAPIWIRVLQAPPAGSLLVDRFGHVIVGLAGRPPQVVKLHKVNGNPVWRQPFDTTGDDEDLHAMAAAPNGDIYATGTSWDETLAPPYDPNVRVFTAKFEMQSGNRLWARVQSPPVRRDARPVAVEPDRLGFVVVAGHWTTSRGMDAFLLRYRASDGATNWVVSRDINNQCEIVTSLAVAPDGQILTAGTTTDPVSQLRRSWVAKTSPAGGRSVWQTLGPAYGLSSVPTGLVLAPNGDLTLVGTSTPDRAASQLFLTRVLGSTGAVSHGLLVSGASVSGRGPTVRLAGNGRLHVGATMMGAKGDTSAAVMQFR